MPRFVMQGQQQPGAQLLPTPQPSTARFVMRPRQAPLQSSSAALGQSLGLIKGATSFAGMGNRALGGSPETGRLLGGVGGATDIGLGALHLSQGQTAPGAIGLASGAGKLLGAAFPNATLGSTLGVGMSGQVPGALGPPSSALGTIPVGSALGNVAGIAGGAYGIQQGIENENMLQGVSGAFGAASGAVSLAAMAGLIASGAGIPLAVALGIASALTGGGSMLTGGPTFEQRQKMIQQFNSGDLARLSGGLGSLGTALAEATSPEDLAWAEDNSGQFFPALSLGDPSKWNTGGQQAHAARLSQQARLFDLARSTPRPQAFALPSQLLTPEEAGYLRANPPGTTIRGTSIAEEPGTWANPEAVSRWRSEFGVPATSALGWENMKQLAERDRVRTALEGLAHQNLIAGLFGSSAALSGNVTQEMIDKALATRAREDIYGPAPDH